MSLTTRTAKGSKLTIAEMDGNLTYLESNGFVDGEYSRTTLGTGEIIGSFSSQGFNTPTIQTSLFIETGENGTYTVSPSGGSGTGAEFELTLISGGRGLSFDLNNSSVTNGGINYEINDQLTVPCSELGGTTGEVTFTLGAGAVSVTTTSTVTVDGTNITISTPSLTVSGSIVVTTTLQANTISGTNISGTNILGTNISGQSLSVFPIGPSDDLSGGPSTSLSLNSFGLRLQNLPESDPNFPGSVWNDSGSLKISSGAGGGGYSGGAVLNP